MSQFVQILTFTSLSFSTCICWFFCGLIYLYILRKPSTSTTLLHKFILDFIKSFLLFITSLNPLMYFILYPVPLNDNVALIFYLSIIYFAFQSLFWLVATILTKYMLVFHPSLFADSSFTDEEIFLKARIRITGLSLIFFILDGLFDPPITETKVFYSLTGKNVK